MKTKITLTIDGTEHHLGSDCLMNWDEVMCTFKRSDLSGIVRAFSSNFEFVNDAYDMLLAAYLKDSVRASASVAIYLLNNDWTWSKEFEAPLDFSTASWDSYIFSINCIDNGLAALIKARKSTKYEFVIGEDIFPDQSLSYDRIKMLNTVTHGIVGHQTTENGYTVLNEAKGFMRLPTYILNDDESYVGSPIVSNDESDESGTFFISVSQAVEELKIKTDILFDGAYNIEIHLFEFEDNNPDFNDSYKDLGTVFKYSNDEAKQRTFLGVYADLAALKKAYPIPPANSWAGVGDPAPLYPEMGPNYTTPYFAPNVDSFEDNEWIEGTNSVYFGSAWQLIFNCWTQKFIRHFTLKNLVPGKKYVLFYKTFIADNVIDRHTTARVKSTITSQWLGRATPISIDAISPKNLLQTIINKITENRIDCSVEISNHDERLSKTYLFGGESIRGIRKAKIYTSFNEFCNWIEAVFGYTYTLGQDTDSDSIKFVHRSELFQNVNQNIEFTQAKDLNCKINNSILYSLIEVGYEKQDYDRQCGRDEWNFMNYYNTGIDCIEKKLTLQSKYRADCYGFEFLAQKRNQDTTDNESDNSIFFVYCDVVEDVIENQDSSTSRGDGTDSVSGVSSHIVLARTSNIQGALSNTVFNGEFSPYYCVKANEGYISAMAPNVKLLFASSDGNSDIIIDGVKTTADIQLSERLFSEIEMKFTASEIEQTVDFDKLITVVKNGVVYSGFLKEMECCYARPSEVEYTLIVKSIEPL